jgi:hypothetical protein
MTHCAKSGKFVKSARPEVWVSNIRSVMGARLRRNRGNTASRRFLRGRRPYLVRRSFAFPFVRGCQSCPTAIADWVDSRMKRTHRNLPDRTPAPVQKMRREAAAGAHHSPYKKPRLSGTLHLFATADNGLAARNGWSMRRGGAPVRPEIYVAASARCG